MSIRNRAYPVKQYVLLMGGGRRSPNDPLKSAISKSPRKRVNLNRPTKLVAKSLNLLGNIIRRETQNKVRWERVLPQRLLHSRELIILDSESPSTLLIESTKMIHRGHNALNLRERHGSTFRFKPNVLELGSILKRSINDKTIKP